ncbi:cAMP-binding protein [Desulfosporosinus orientis DSM 765]|uniref:cAMP-binding protein n=1 Tax=Desulfosporosinus orientis (strain ATCC 19365 / DSM 765 / NCIMB 8382 / VKM B-1628 / Singapore I) TaxID=768706 RepID=G7WJ52_DESOD|nr:helix-turn-helix domain-containing protein [Desulfosporosinus orientis]AET70364.1 cAMP-binding protein [Desulfosporosinus orientis DSM 765]
MNLAQTIQYLRKKNSLSQDQLADRLGITRQSISKWESERSTPDIEKVVLLSEIFGVTTDYLLKNTKCAINTAANQQTIWKKYYMELINMPGISYCELKKGTTLVEQGERIDYIYYLVSGTCYRRSITEKGDELIINIKEAGDFVGSLVGVFALYTENRTLRNSIITATRCYCYKIPIETFSQFVEDKPEILTELLKLFTTYYREVLFNLQARQEGKVPNSLCEFLINKAEIKHGKLIVPKKNSSNAEISRLIGIHRVTVAKIIKALKNKGIILKENEGIVILDKEEMMRYVRAEKILNY